MIVVFPDHTHLLFSKIYLDIPSQNKSDKRFFDVVTSYFVFDKYVFSHNFQIKVSEGAKIRNRYNQVPHLTQDTNGKVTNSDLDTKNESQEVSPFPAGDHKAI